MRCDGADLRLQLGRCHDRRALFRRSGRGMERAVISQGRRQSLRAVAQTRHGIRGIGIDVLPHQRRVQQHGQPLAHAAELARRQPLAPAGPGPGRRQVLRGARGGECLALGGSAAQPGRQVLRVWQRAGGECEAGGEDSGAR